MEISFESFADGTPTYIYQDKLWTNKRKKAPNSTQPKIQQLTVCCVRCPHCRPLAFELRDPCLRVPLARKLSRGANDAVHDWCTPRATQDANQGHGKLRQLCQRSGHSDDGSRQLQVRKHDDQFLGTIFEYQVQQMAIIC